MDNQRLEEILAQRADRENEQKNEQARKLAEIMNKYQKVAQKWLPKVREWIENAELLARNGFTFEDSNTYWCFNKKHTNFLDAKNKTAVLCTDGVHHGFGFYKKSISIMGIMQGGCCGDWHIKTDGWSWWIQNGTEKKPLRIGDYIDLFQKMENFAQRMELFFKELEK